MQARIETFSNLVLIRQDDDVDGALFVDRIMGDKHETRKAAAAVKSLKRHALDSSTILAAQVVSPAIKAFTEAALQAERRMLTLNHSLDTKTLNRLKETFDSL